MNRSAISAEVIAFSDIFDISASLVAELSKLFLKQLPLQLFTDTKSLFDVISKRSRTSEKRATIDIAATREAFKSGVISDIGFNKSNKNIADGLTKSMSQAMLRKVMETGVLDIQADQWIIRS